MARGSSGQRANLEAVDGAPGSTQLGACKPALAIVQA